MSSLGMHVLRAVATRASLLGDLVREVLRTSFTLVEASSKSVRQAGPIAAASSLELGAVR